MAVGRLNPAGGIELLIPETVVSNASELVFQVSGPDPAPIGLSFAIFRMPDYGPALSVGGGLQIGERPAFPVGMPFPYQETGLHVVVAGISQVMHPPFSPDGAPVWIGPSAPVDLPVAVRDAIEVQAAYAEDPIRREGYTGDQRYVVHVLLESALVDYPQIIRGGRVQPLSFGLGFESALSVVNRVFTYSFQPTQQTYDNIARGHPMCLVTYSRVLAPSETEAIDAIIPQLQLLKGILSIERGASAVNLAFVVENPTTQTAHLIWPADNYRGNLVGGFASGQITQLLDQTERASRSGPWVPFILQLYSEAKAEKNDGMRLFRAWSMIEAAAKRSVPRSGDQVLDDAGDEIPYRGGLTRNHDPGRVLHYLRSIGRSGGVNVAGRDYRLPALVMGAYALRNMVAHEGGLRETGRATPLTPAQVAGLDLLRNAMLVSWLFDAAEMIFRWESRDP
jgi:hypothetical protein